MLYLLREHAQVLLFKILLLFDILLQLPLFLILPIIIIVIKAVINEINVYIIAATIKAVVPPNANAKIKNIEKAIPATLSGQFINVSNIMDRIIVASGIAKKINKIFI